MPDNGRLVHYCIHSNAEMWHWKLQQKSEQWTICLGVYLRSDHTISQEKWTEKWLPVDFCCIFQSHLESWIWVQGSHSQCPALRSCYAWGVHPGTIMQVWICFCSSFFGLILQVHVKFFHWSMDPFKSNHGLENHVPFFPTMVYSDLGCPWWVFWGIYVIHFPHLARFFVQAEKSSLRTFHDYSEIVCTHGDDLICWVHNL